MSEKSGVTTSGIGTAVIVFAEKYLEPFEIRNNELVAEICPFCKGGENLDKRTFYLSLENGLYQCKRGSCAKKGRLEDLARDFGDNVSIDREYHSQRQRKNFDIPDIELLPVTDEIIAYFNQKNI